MNGSTQVRRGDGARPLIVGLTGGIAAGKSVVARLFCERGAAVVDADELAREVVAPGTPGHAAVLQAFGAAIADSSGAIDRRRLGVLVFADGDARRRLEAITHPAIAAAAERRFTELAGGGHAAVVYEAALLVEAGRRAAVDVLLVVVADDELRLRRLMARNALARAAAEVRLRSQLPQAEKARLADYVIDNSGTLEETAARVAEVWRELQAAAARRSALWREEQG